MKSQLLILPALLLCVTSCSDDSEQSAKASKKPVIEKPKPVFVSTYRPVASEDFIITHATVLTGTGERLDDASVWVKQGKIHRVSVDLAATSGSKVIDASGKWLTPGIIDIHSHLGVYPSPSHAMNQDGNEMTEPVTAQVWAEHAVWPQDPGFNLARAGGVTSLMVLPGSANLIGGRGVTLKNVPAVTMQGMKFPDAPHALKMACGENPKRVYGEEKGSAPMTRMGNVAGYREAWIAAKAYREKWDKYYASETGDETVDKPDRDLKLETLAEVLSGEILVHNHCYRAEEMAVMIDIAKEFDYKITAFHHAIEAYKVADLLAENQICAAMWADWWGFKHEAFDTVSENVALVEQAKACAIVHSDSAQGIQRLNQESAKAMAAGNKMGLAIKPEQAIRWITSNPAKAMGIGEVTGSLEVGKMADLVVWDQNPFSVYAKAEQVFIDGALVYELNNPSLNHVSDFELGISDPQGAR